MTKTQLKQAIFDTLRVSSIRELKRQYPQFRHLRFQLKADFQEVADILDYSLPPDLSLPLQNIIPSFIATDPVLNENNESTYQNMTLRQLKIEVFRLFRVDDCLQLKLELSDTIEYRRFARRDFRRRETYIEILEYEPETLTQILPRQQALENNLSNSIEQFYRNLIMEHGNNPFNLPYENFNTLLDNYPELISETYENFLFQNPPVIKENHETIAAEPQIVQNGQSEDLHTKYQNCLNKLRHPIEVDPPNFWKEGDPICPLRQSYMDRWQKLRSDRLVS